MKFKELFTGTDGIFTVFEQSFPDAYQKIFGGIAPRQLNAYVLGACGNKVLCDYITADSWQSFVETNINMNLFNWVRQSEVLKSQYDVTLGDSVERKKTGTEGYDTNETDTNLYAKKPFNNENFDDSERQSRAKQRGEERTYNLTETETKHLNGGYVTENVKREIAMRRLNLQRQIMLDIVNDITLSVYE